MGCDATFFSKREDGHKHGKVTIDRLPICIIRENGKIRKMNGIAINVA